MSDLSAMEMRLMQTWKPLLNTFVVLKGSLKWVARRNEEIIFMQLASIYLICELLTP